MTWTYDQSTGDVFHDGKFIGTGYSGAGRTRDEGRNNGDMQTVKQKGPIPRGIWKIGKAMTSKHTGPISMRLTPDKQTNVFGRDAFLIHGDNAASNASHGCIILSRGIRLEISGSGDTALEVVA